MSKNSTIGLVTRTRNKWKQTGKQRTTEDNATALGYIIWQLALNGARKLHAEDFRYDGDDQRVRVIEEYLAYLIHLADRAAFDNMDESQRAEFVSGTARSAARHLQRNKEDILGTGDYAADFLDFANRRSGEYGECSWRDGPGHSMRRSLAAHVQRVMGSDQTNKWVMDQVTDIDAPELHRQFADSMNSLVSSS